MSDLVTMKIPASTRDRIRETLPEGGKIGYRTNHLILSGMVHENRMNLPELVLVDIISGEPMAHAHMSMKDADDKNDTLEAAGIGAQWQR
jgi:hypothetical protein